VARYLEPIINGHRYSYASIEVIVNGIIIVGVRSVTYASTLEPGVIYGSDAQKLGRTPGEVKHRCELEIYRREWTVLMETLGQSFGRTLFDVVVQYAEEGDEGVTTDAIYACRVTEVELANQDDNNATTVRLALDPMEIRLGANQLSIELADFSDFKVAVS
jgi:hypothetical protein